MHSARLANQPPRLAAVVCERAAVSRAELTLRPLIDNVSKVSKDIFHSESDRRAGTMAPNLAASDRALIRDMIHCSSLTTAQIADAAHCSERSVRHIRSNLRCFGTTRAPFNGVGRPRSITPPMLRALCEHLIEKPELFQDEMGLFLWDEFEAQVTVYSIGRALASVGWSKKAARRVAKERNADLRDFYLHKLSFFRSYQLVYVDESGCDKRIGFRRTGWSPVGVTPV
jgi:hypothetical protein